MSEDPLVGKQLGQYEIVSVIGKGGMATVYKGLQVAVNRIVAIKVLPGSFMHDDTFMSRFRQEAEVAAQLEHIRILPIYDYGETDGIPYIVMRYIDGGTVRDYTSRGPCETELTLRVVRQVAEALDYAHACDVIHRDLKPSNIMLDAAGNTYLTDFGTAKLRDRSAQLTGSGIVGTPAYMAPEQSMPGQVTPAVDIYALGVTLFEMIAGHVPYSADTPIVQILMHIQHPVPSLREYNPSVPQAVDEVVRHAMAKRPDERYACAGDLADALVNAVHAVGGWLQSAGDVVPQLQEDNLPTGVVVSGSYGEAGAEAGALDDTKGTASVVEEAGPVAADELGAAYADEVGADYAGAAGYRESGYRSRPSDRYSSPTASGTASVPYTPPGSNRGQTTIPRTRPLLSTSDGIVFDLKSSNILVGRDDHQKGIFVDIDLTDLDLHKRSSRSHARFLERGGEYIVWDLHSMNGTYVNGYRIPDGGRQVIQDGDAIQFGKDGVILIFQW